MSIRGSLKFKSWESSAILNTLEKVNFQKLSLEEACIEHKIVPTEIGTLTVDAAEYYEILVAFELLSNTLMEYELLAEGYPKFNYRIH